VWGSGPYTDDSSVCTAGVHAGVITLAEGGTVRIEIDEGHAGYEGSTAHGITTRPYGSFFGSFVVLGSDQPPTDPASETGVRSASWKTCVENLRGSNGKQVTYRCPPGGSPQSVWGSGPYTDDSSVCTAAVHAGVITLAKGGTVRVEVQPGQSGYMASTAHGITTRSYGAYEGSFVVLGPGSGSSKGKATAVKQATWSTAAKPHRGQDGKRFRYRCPSGTASKTVWGSDPYTDDSSICTAAVHAGVLSRGTGGTVTIEIKPGRSSYRGSTRHGVTTRDFHKFPGSFTFVR
jgi:hypothetical protein